MESGAGSPELTRNTVSPREMLQQLCRKMMMKLPAGSSTEFQKSLWKNQVEFPKADGQLKALGLTNLLKEKFTSKKGEESNGEAEEDGGGGPPPPKKAKVEESIAEAIEVEVKLNNREKKKLEALPCSTHNSGESPLQTPLQEARRRRNLWRNGDVYKSSRGDFFYFLKGQASEWALLRRHPVEDLFGVQICGSHADSLSRTAELISVDFIDINVGSRRQQRRRLLPSNEANKTGADCAGVMDKPLTLKMRTGYFEGRNCAHSIIPGIGSWGVSAVTVHGRTRQERYSKLADWAYIYDCAKQVPEDVQVLGNGDIFSYVDWNEHLSSDSGLSSCMIARGALIKPWLFAEIKEQRHWDITSSERLGILRDYTNFGLEHWGSDSKGVETTRRFLLEWLSYTYRYVPVGLLEVVPQKLNWRPPCYVGRDDLETPMASDSAADWVRISEMLLGPAPAGFVFTPKHKSNAYDKAENG